jgi:hypothetical protein
VTKNNASSGIMFTRSFILRACAAIHSDRAPADADSFKIFTPGEAPRSNA